MTGQVVPEGQRAEKVLLNRHQLRAPVDYAINSDLCH